MELTNEFRVGVPLDRAWSVLTDVERIAPCLPGAELQEIEGEEYRGIVKVKVGPITAQYKGKATFLEQDKDAGRIVLKAEGRDTRGQGNANATVTATLRPNGDGTDVSVVTDLAITGKVAQFGRGVLAEVSAKLLTQFVDNLERDVLAAGDPTPPDAPPNSVDAIEAQAIDSEGPVVLAPDGPNADRATPPPTVRKVDSRPAEAVDLLDAAGGSVAKRAAPVVGTILFLLWILVRRRRRRKS